MAYREFRRKSSWGEAKLTAEATGRRAVLVEVDPRYCDVIVRRWQDATRKTARLEEDGRTFEELAGERLVGSAGEEVA